MIYKTLTILTFVLCAANLAFYAWGTQDPANLAVGIFCGFVTIFNVLVEKK